MLTAAAISPQSKAFTSILRRRRHLQPTTRPGAIRPRRRMRIQHPQFPADRAAPFHRDHPERDHGAPPRVPAAALQGAACGPDTLDLWGHAHTRSAHRDARASAFGNDAGCPVLPAVFCALVLLPSWEDGHQHRPADCVPHGESGEGLRRMWWDWRRWDCGGGARGCRGQGRWGCSRAVSARRPGVESMQTESRKATRLQSQPQRRRARSRTISW